MVKLFTAPSQVTDPFSKWGVTVMVATTGAVAVLVTVNDGMSSVPLAARPMEVLSLVQV